jgi:hypothetical protein
MVRCGRESMVNILLTRKTHNAREPEKDFLDCVISITGIDLLSSDTLDEVMPGIFHRAAVAIVLIATLILPYGRCQSPGKGAGHDCCQHHSAPAASLKAGCCTVRGETPAIVAEKDRANDMSATQNELVPVVSIKAMPKSAAIPALPHFSPPGGKSILRI